MDRNEIEQVLSSAEYCQHSGVKLVLDVEAMEGQPLHKPSVIEQIATIINNGGPYNYILREDCWQIFDEDM